jgi:DNA-binding GntR family transcriptional regulator
MKERLSDGIYTQLQGDIISGALKPNTFVTEGELAERYGVSKAPVKAALRALVEEGYLIAFPRRGFMVSAVSVEDYEHVRELRGYIERLSVMLAVRRASDAEIDSLEETLAGDPAEKNPFLTRNTRFHARLAEISHNPYVGEVLHKLLGVASRYAITADSADASHENLIAALRRRDEAAALDALDEDLHLDTSGYWKPRENGG